MAEGGLEEWLPLFQIFLDSAAADGDASLWLRNHRRSGQHPTTAFLSLLLSAAPSLHLPSAIFLQTLPQSLQSRVLSFLAVHHRLFPRSRLRSLAARVLDYSGPALGPAFWARKAAQHLLDSVSFSTPVPSSGEENDDGIYALPEWLKDPVFASDPLLTWLPIAPGLLPKTTDRSISIAVETQAMDLVTDREDARESSGSATYSSPLPPPLTTKIVLSPRLIERVLSLKENLLASEAPAEVIRLAELIRQLCSESGNGSHLAILDLLEPWETLDETASLLLSSLSGEHVLNFTGWHAHLLCSILLPKFLFLQQPPSRLLLSSTIQFCRLHPVAAVEALLFPLALRKEGLNAALCDVLARVVKECLHPVHASSACQRLLSANAMDRNPVLLARHRESIRDEVVWTESMFVLFQHILNQKVSLPPDSVDCLASAIDEKASEFSGSLKFGNLMLCFVTKCDGALKHKTLLEKAAGRTQTFVTKSILSKLNVM
ncbi:uncharacterized protein LOC122013218 [Zingiber officinale]|uniref:Fanconi Anaemia group E protein C-terminal domain-containing protein n=1 Tax=Zingiber officinale TaxID=94328 RepID=A0A8J5LTW1_ZINOF|nr:uncharacterized protein LOC122013218 [Zingiber officinale]KAG6538844.1 hypothetical protein ZIOFF_003995 [Zingiber officinale]